MGDAVHRDVYVARDTRPTASARAKAAWSWSGRAGVVAGRSAAVLHGAKWVDDAAPAEILYDNRRPPKGICTWSDQVAEGEVETVRGMAVSTPARTALDLARLKMADVELLAERYKGRRGIRDARVALDLVDPGAESPQETDEYGQLVAELDMGWRDVTVGVDYEGDHHWRNRRAFDRGIRRHAEVTELGWDDVRITAEDSDGAIIGRVGRARLRV